MGGSGATPLPGHSEPRQESSLSGLKAAPEQLQRPHWQSPGSAANAAGFHISATTKRSDQSRAFSGSSFQDQLGGRLRIRRVGGVGLHTRQGQEEATRFRNNFIQDSAHQTGKVTSLSKQRKMGEPSSKDQKHYLIAD